MSQALCLSGVNLAAASVRRSRTRARRVVPAASGPAHSFEESAIQSCTAVDDQAEAAAQCWLNVANMAQPGTPLALRAEQEVRARAAVLRPRPVDLLLEAAGADEDILKSGFIGRLFWFLSEYGHSASWEEKQRRAARRKSALKRDLWLNEDGTVDFVNADAPAE